MTVTNKNIERLAGIVRDMLALMASAIQARFDAPQAWAVWKNQPGGDGWVVTDAIKQALDRRDAAPRAVAAQARALRRRVVGLVRLIPDHPRAADMGVRARGALDQIALMICGDCFLVGRENLVTVDAHGVRACPDGRVDPFLWELADIADELGMESRVYRERNEAAAIRFERVRTVFRLNGWASEPITAAAP